jgi:acetamidase/formamidase/AraC-like DNA-binding protein
MLDDLQRFSTDAYPESLRRTAWSAALATALLCSEEGGAGAHVPLHGYVSSRDTALGTVFLRLSSSPQVLVPCTRTDRRTSGSVLVLALLEGSGTVTHGHESAELDAASIVLLDPARAWRFELASRFRALAVRLESATFLLRLVRTTANELNIVSADIGAGAMCVDVMRSVADHLDELGRHDLLAVETTLTDLLVTSLSHVEDDASDDTTSVRLGHLRRVCRTVEARLADADFDIGEVARLEGLSTRYVQELFKAASTTFGSFLKERRLERCRIDLVNRALDHVTIAEICYRWGFGDAANFSRAFTARFGISPKAYRANPPPHARSHRQRGRPAKVGVVDPPARDAHAGASGDAPGSEFQNLLGEHARATFALAIPDIATSEVFADGGSLGRPPDHYHVPVSEKTVHWGYFSASLKPVLTVRSGDIVTLETLTQHASDDRARMVDGDAGAESVFHWTAERKAVDRRGAGPANASIYGRGTGEGFGVHICTGPVFIRNAEPGDVLEIRVLDVRFRPSCSPAHHGRVFGSNAAAWWGFHYHDLITEPKEREVVTLYEIIPDAAPPYAKALYNFRWTPQTDPFGVRHDTIDYPGVIVDERSVDRRYGVLKDAQVPLRPHFGVLAVAPREAGLIDSIPPGYFGGNLDNWRAGKGAKLFLPVSVPGALFSAGDPHASQGDSEVCGTAIECSLTGAFQLVLHKRSELAGTFLGDLDFPFLETTDAWVLQGLSYPNHLAELGADAQAEIYKRSSLEAAMRDAFNKARRYLMEAHGLTEDEAISLISVAVDFGVTQVVDGNWGVHAVIRKALFPSTGASGETDSA